MKISKILYYIFSAFIVLIALLFVVSVFPITGNFKILTVSSGSMEPAIYTGSVVIIKPANDYKIGDIVTFNPSAKKETPVTHRIYDIRVEGGQPVYITKGDANESQDVNGVAKKNVVGKVLFSLPYFGYLINFVKQPIGFMLIIILPTAVIIYDEIKKIFREVKNRNEENIAQ